MLIEPEFEDAGIVLIGDFNPAIFNPDWLLLNKLVGSEATNQSVIDIVHPDLAQLRVGTLELVVQRNRFQITTGVAPFVTISDFITKAFGEALPHTPVRQFGINHSVHFTVGTEEIRNAIGRILAPTQPWGWWGEEIAKGSGELRGGMVNLQMQEVQNVEGFSRRITTTVQPSMTVAHRAGIYAAVNDHNEPVSPATSSMTILEKLASQFDSSIVR